MGPWGGMGWGYGANVVMDGLNYSVDFYLFLIDSGDLEMTEKILDGH